MNLEKKKKKQVEGCCCLLYSIKGKGEMGLEVSSFHFVCSSLIIIDNCSSSSSLVLNLKLSPTYHKLEIRHFLPYGTPPPSPPPLLLPLSLLNIGGANESFSFTLVIVLD